MWTKKAYAPISIAIVACVVLFGLFFRNRAPAIENAPRVSPAQTLRVVTTFFPLYDFARHVGGDRIALDILFSQTPEVSSFSPADVRKINTADIVIKNGAGLEPILDDLIRASDNARVAVVDTSRGITLLKPAQSLAMPGKENEVADGPDDPHVWLDPLNAIVQVENIRDAFAARDAGNAEYYRQNADAYAQELRALHETLAAEITRLPRNDFIAFHGAFRYFAARYSLRQAAVIETFPGKEPSPQYVAEVIKIIKASNAKVIFSEPQFSSRLIEVIAKDLDLQVRSLNPLEAGTLGQDSYVSLMRKNLETLKEALALR